MTRTRMFYLVLIKGTIQQLDDILKFEVNLSIELDDRLPLEYLISYRPLTNVIDLNEKILFLVGHTVNKDLVRAVMSVNKSQNQFAIISSEIMSRGIPLTYENISKLISDEDCDMLIPLIDFNRLIHEYSVEEFKELFFRSLNNGNSPKLTEYLSKTFPAGTIQTDDIMKVIFSTHHRISTIIYYIDHECFNHIFRIDNLESLLEKYLFWAEKTYDFVLIHILKGWISGISEWQKI